MSAEPLADLPLNAAGELDAEDLKSCCAQVYAHPAVRWLLDGELHPGGDATTRRALDLLGISPQDRLLDVASGAGSSALLAAAERGCEVVGIEYSAAAVDEANAAADAAGPDVRMSFAQGDAESLPLPDASFDAVICECSLCVFPDKPQAMAEIRRVLRPAGRVAISDVVADRRRLPELTGALATIACVGEALTAAGYRSLLADGGFEQIGEESCDEEAVRLAERVEDRLRGARMLGLTRLGIDVDEAIAIVRQAREAIEQGALGYSIFSART